MGDRVSTSPDLPLVDAVGGGFSGFSRQNSHPAMEVDFALLDAIAADLERLATAYREEAGTPARQAAAADNGRMLQRRWAFQLAEYGRSLLLNAIPKAMSARHAGPLPHVVVFGGTQVGKSTAVNVLTGRESARVHHTAGFTRHAQAFAPPDAHPEELFGLNPYPLSRFHRTTMGELSNDRLMEYSLEALSGQPIAGPMVIWDAPDCDAVGSQSYLPGMVESLALADVVLYVTSGQKYAIRHVLTWLAEIMASGKPVVALLNMAPRAHQDDLLHSMQTAISTVADETAADYGLAGENAESFRAVPAVAFEFVPDGDSSILTAREYQPGRQLRQLVGSAASEALSESARLVAARRGIDYLLRRLPALCKPALAETTARDEFQELSQKAVRDFVQNYRAAYLDNPSNFDAFTLVGLEILKLLDPPIPGARQAITAIRTAVGIPARLLTAGVRSLYRSLAPGGSKDGSRQEGTQPKDAAAVRGAHEGLLQTVSQEIARQASSPGQGAAYWKALEWAWERAAPDIESEFRVQARRLEEKHADSIRETAQSIYNEIARDPIKLNLLRTGRLSADAAAIVLSIKAGGHGGELIHSVVFAPILLSVTEAASQMIADNHVTGLREGLRKRLLAETEALGQRVYAPRLDAVAMEAARMAGISELDGMAIRSLPERLMALRATLPHDKTNP